MASADAAGRVAALETDGRLEEAAELAEVSGMAARASQLFERACRFDRASTTAAQAGDLPRAVLLAVLSGNENAIQCAIEAAGSGDAGRARSAAAAARSRGHGAVAGKLLERIGELREAAQAYAEAGHAVEAAACFDRAGEARDAARVLDAAHRANPNDGRVAVSLGALLVKHARWDAAMLALQRVEVSSPQRSTAVPLLRKCAEALGLEEPARALEQEAERLGVTNREPPEHAAASSEQGQVVYGRYEILRSVASTHTARVFEAKDRLTGSHVAVKQLVAANVTGAGRDAFDRLLREAQVLEQLRHPNVVPLVELLAANTAIVTPWMAGGSLAALIESTPIVPARAVEITCAVLSALGEAHRLGILHRDVKPSNVLFDDAGVPRLADFGAAHVSDTSATATAGVIGTFAYMSPEQRMGLPATAASDIFSAGATLYEMLVGAPPSPPGTVVATPSLANANLGSHHDALVLRLIAHNPLERPASASEARAMLEAMPWPVDRSRTRSAATAPQAVEQPSRERLDRLATSIANDTWLERRVLLVAANTETIRTIKMLSAAACEALPAVLRFDAEANEIWVEVPRGALLRHAGRRLLARERDQLLEGLQSLHAQGAAHGSVDEDHVVLGEGFARFLIDPAKMAKATEQSDLAGLARLG